MSENAQAAAVAAQLKRTKLLSIPATRQLLSQLFIEFSHNPDFIWKVGRFLYRDVEYTLAGYIFEGLTKTHPRFAPAYNEYGLILASFGHTEKADEAYQKAVMLAPTLREARANLAFNAYFCGEPGRPEILELQKDVSRYHFGEAQTLIDLNSINKDSGRRIRVGYVSGDLHEHPVARFMEGILGGHDASQFDVYVFDDFLQDFESSSNKRMRADFKNWFDVRSLNDEELTRLVVENKIDILVDLAGHTGSGRVRVFHNRIAPVQVTYLGCPGSSGIPNMDFRIGDEYADLMEFSDQNSERMMRLPCAMWNYQPWPTMTTKEKVVKKGNKQPLLFGSANNHSKLQPEWLDVWAKILARVPDSHLLLKSRVMNDLDVIASVSKIFEKHGVSADRIEFCHYSPTPSDHWDKLRQIDIALDSYPYNGATTTCDLLWLGVPVLALAGKSHVSRTTASILNTLGLNDWIAETPEDFVNLAVAKAQDLPRLRKVKKSLNSRFQNSTLNNVSEFMNHYESALRSMWQLYCDDAI